MKYLIYSVLVQFEIMLSALMILGLLNYVAIPLTPDLLSQAPKYWHLYWFVMCVHFAQRVITVKDCDPNE